MAECFTMLSHFPFRDECIFSFSFSVTAPAVDFESTGFSAGRMVKRAVLHKYYENDYLCYVRVVTDADEEVLEHNDYSGFGQRLESSTGSANRYRYNGKEEQITGSLGLTGYGARFYDCILPRWTNPDPLAEKYTSTLNVFAHTEFAAAVLLVVEIIFLDDLETAFLKSALSPVPVPPDDIRSLSFRGSVCFCAGPFSCFIYLFQRFPAG